MADGTYEVSMASSHLKFRCIVSSISTHLRITFVIRALKSRDLSEKILGG